MTTRAFRGAILGFGHVAAAGHMPFWEERPDVEIVAIADSVASRREMFLRTRPEGRVYAAAEALLAAERLDFVDVCTPPSSHAACVEQALDAGLDVLCEKPLTISAADALRIAGKAEAAGRSVHVVHNWLEAPVCRKVSALLAEGAVGTVRSVAWDTSRTGVAAAVGADGGNWRMDPRVAGGGILLDHGWHAAYCVARWAGAAPTSLSARLEQRHVPSWPVEDTAWVDIRFGDVEGHIHLTWAALERSNTVSVIGDRGSIEVAGAEVMLHDSSGIRRWTCPPSLADGSHHPDWFAAVGRDFLNVLAGTAPGNLREAVLCALLMETARKSGASGGEWLPVEDISGSRSGNVGLEGSRLSRPV
ncbi:MAG: putative Oxidoreductase domain protein [Alphaproteobacteria bacterium]|nr:putative Oxidoreductase domain protein [Alphaproteobacteria bacterium]